MKCVRQLPVIKSLAQEFEGRAAFVQIITREDGPNMTAFDIGSYPGYLVYRDGVEVDRLTLNFAAWGLESRLRGMVDSALEEERP